MCTILESPIECIPDEEGDAVGCYRIYLLVSVVLDSDNVMIYELMNEINKGCHLTACLNYEL